MPRKLLSVVFVLVCLSALDRAAIAQTGANVLVIANEASADSLKIATTYVDRRGVPAEQLVRVRVATKDEISRAEFERNIQAPIAFWLSKNRGQDRILYLVLTKGIPLRIAGTPGRTGTISSVDSELTLLYRRMAGQQVPFNGLIANPYYLGEADLAKAMRFGHTRQDIFLVTRLDGFTLNDALGLIDRGIAPVTTGRILLDQRASLSDKPNDWLAAAAAKLKAQGFEDRVTLERTSRPVMHEKDVLGYYSWGSNDPAISQRNLDIAFVPGAIAGTFVSTDARTFAEPPVGWRPGRWETQPAFFAGSPQSLTGDLVRAGVTGVAGQVAEPFLDSAVRPDILFPAYVSGFNLAEAFYLAMPALSWQTVVLGDPLCAPFPKPPLTAAELDPPFDPETELPTLFAARLVASSAVKSKNPAAARLSIRAASRQARGDVAGAREALEQAVALDDSFNDAWRVLGTIYDQLDESDKATAIYRKLVDRDPKDTVALNNLAYALAVREGKPAEALPLAEKAAMLAPRSATVLDTVAWIRHLLGDDAAALRAIAIAAQSLPENPDVQLHAAVICANLGRLEDAAKLLKIVERLDPSFKDRPEFKDVQQKIAK